MCEAGVLAGMLHLSWPRAGAGASPRLCAKDEWSLRAPLVRGIVDAALRTATSTTAASGRFV